MLIGCGFRLPAGVLNLQVQQIPRRNQKSSRGVRYKHMQVKSQQRQKITQTFGGLRGPFYWRHLHLLFILINKLNTFSDLFNPHLTLYVIPQLCPNLFLNNFPLVVFIHVLLWSTCQFTSFWSCMIFDTCVTSLSTRSLWFVLIVVILTGRCCGRYAMMIVLLAFFNIYPTDPLGGGYSGNNYNICVCLSNCLSHFRANVNRLGQMTSPILRSEKCAFVTDGL